MLETPAFASCLAKLVPDKMQPDGSAPLHRKFWEWAFIAEALAERGCLQMGKRGLGFAVGTEALPAYFAGLGCEILATDCPTDDVQNLQFWSTTNQHDQSTADLLRPDLCPSDLFAQRVKFRPVDMKRLPSDLRGFDFCWSACAFEHLGSLPLGMDFVEASLDCLKPGGIAIHTTEFNVLANTFTPDVGPYVIYRRCDIEGLVERLRANGHAIDIDYATGDGRWDHEIDYPPYRWKHHLILQRYTTIGVRFCREIRAARFRCW